MPIKDAEKIVYMQCNVLCINSKTAKHIFDIRGASVFECPSDSLNLNPIKRFEIS